MGIIYKNNNSEMPNPIGADVCGPYINVLELQRIARRKILDKIVINTKNDPIKIEFVNYKDRLATFTNWPKDSKISAKMLSAAGFIYNNSEDRTSCFHCGGILSAWNVYDDPWIEHAYWFPECKFLFAEMGQEFIDSAFIKKHDLKAEYDLKVAIKPDCLVRTVEKMKKQIKKIESSNLDDSESKLNAGRKSMFSCFACSEGKDVCCCHGVS